MTTIAEFKGFIPNTFGPKYPNLGAKVARLRAIARRDPSRHKEYGEAVLAQVREMQRAALQQSLPTVRVNCASGTSHTTGAAILKAIRNQHARALGWACSDSHKARTDEQVRKLYAEAMAAKRAAAEGVTT